MKSEVSKEQGTKTNIQPDPDRITDHDTRLNPGHHD